MRALTRAPQGCPGASRGGSSVRTENSPEVAAFLAKRQTEEAPQIYRERGKVAAFPNAGLKAQSGRRQFRVRGLQKGRGEGLWAVRTDNLPQGFRIVWRPQHAPPPA